MDKKPSKPVQRHYEAARKALGWHRPPSDGFVLPRLASRQFEGGVGFTDPRRFDWEDFEQKARRKP
jgi:hypothetical protein